MKKSLISLICLLSVWLIATFGSGNVFASTAKSTYKLVVLNQAPSLGKVYSKAGTVKSGKSVTIKVKPRKKYFATIVQDGKIVKTSRSGKALKYKLRMRADHTVKIYFTAAGKKFVLPPTPVSLNWSAPEQRENGDELLISEIRGYQIHYDSADKKIRHTIVINDPEITSALVEVSKAGAYYFSIATVDIDGDKSRMSNPVKIIIR